MPRGPETSRTDATRAQRHTLPRRRDPVLWLIVCGCMLISAIVIGTIVLADGFRQRALTNAKRELENTVLLLARHFEQQFEDADTVAKDAIARLRISSIDSQEAFRARMSTTSVHELLRSVNRDDEAIAILTRLAEAAKDDGYVKDRLEKAKKKEDRHVARTSCRSTGDGDSSTSF